MTGSPRDEPATWGMVRGGSLLHYWQADRPWCLCGAHPRDRIPPAGFTLDPSDTTIKRCERCREKLQQLGDHK